MSLRLIGATLRPRKVPFECETAMGRMAAPSPFLRVYDNNKRYRIAFLIDEEDFEKIKPFKWRFGSSCYPMANMVFEKEDNGVIEIVRKPIYLHHFVLGLHEYHLGRGKLCVDHIDGDKKHNNKTNLRVTTPKVNTTHAKTLGRLMKINLKRRDGSCRSTSPCEIYIDMIRREPPLALTYPY